MTKRIPMFLTLILIIPFCAYAQKGYFQYDEARFEIVDTLAYVVDNPEDPKQPMTIVAMADFPIDRDEVMAALDPAGALSAQVAKQERGNFVLVRLHPPDKCGVFAYLGETAHQIMLSDDFSATTATATPARVSGKCHAKTKDGADYSFDLPYDVAVTKIPKPTKLGPGGGEPGKAFLKLTKAIEARDWKNAQPHLRTREIAFPPKADEVDSYFENIGLNYPRSATVTGGMIKGDRALIEMKGTDSEGKKIKGFFSMSKADGQWRVVEQELYFDE